MRMHLLIGCVFLVFMVPVQAIILKSDIEHRVRSGAMSALVTRFPTLQLEDIQIGFRHFEQIEKYIPKNGHTFKVRISDKIVFIGRQTVPVLFFNKKGVFLNKYTVVLDIKAKAMLFQTLRSLKTGEIVKMSDVFTFKSKINRRTKSALMETKLLIDKEVRFDIKKGEVIYPWMVRTSPVIRANDAIAVTVVSDGVELKVDGVARRDGIVGDIIEVRLVLTNKILKGEVVDGKNVRVDPRS